MKKFRNSNIDILKAISAYLVCYSHFNNSVKVGYEYWLSLEGMIGYMLLAVSSMAVPLFLMINGYLVINKVYSYDEYVKKAIKIILITTVWCILYNIIFSCFFREGKKVSDILYAVYNGIYTGEYISIRNWFFYALSVCYLLSPLIKKVFESDNKNLIKYMFFLPAIYIWGNDLWQKIILLVGYQGRITEVFPRTNIFDAWDSFALLYYLFGGILYKYAWGEENRIKKLILAAVSLFIIWGYGILYVYKNKIFYNIVWGGYPSCFLFAASGLLAAVLINYRGRISNVIKFLGERIAGNTFGIYFVHLLIGSFFKPYYVERIRDDSLFGGIVYASLVFAISYFVTDFIKKVPVLKRIVTL